MVASDRISAFDVVLAEPIPDKGRVLTAMTVHWLDELADLAPSHLITADPAELPRRGRRPGRRGGSPAWPGGRCSCAGPRCSPSSASCGATWPGRPGRSTERRGTLHGTPLPAGLRAGRAGSPSPCSRPRPRPPRATTSTSPSTRPSTWWARRWPSRPRDLCVEAYRRGRGGGRAQRHHRGRHQVRARAHRRRAGPLRRGAHPRLVAVLARRRVAPGHQPARRSTSSRCATGSRTSGWDKQPPPPPLPPEVVAARRAQRYVAAYERISGRRLADWYGATR